MEKTKRSKLSVAKFVFLALYFVILTVERAISLAVCFTGDLSELNSLDYYMIALTVFGIFGAYIYGAVRFTVDIRNSDERKRGGVFGDLAVAAGILLFGGMVHTKGSIPPIQFASYGMILISMAIHTVQNIKNTGSAAKSWIAFAYTVAYSMAIPVVYPPLGKLPAAFVPVEIAVSAGMVIMFTVMLRRFYNGYGENGYFPVWFLFALIGDAAVLALRWTEEINWFVLIFVSLTTVLWVTGTILKSRAKKT